MFTAPLAPLIPLHFYQQLPPLKEILTMYKNPANTHKREGFHAAMNSPLFYLT